MCERIRLFLPGIWGNDGAMARVFVRGGKFLFCRSTGTAICSAPPTDADENFGAGLQPKLRVCARKCFPPSWHATSTTTLDTSPFSMPKLSFFLAMAVVVVVREYISGGRTVWLVCANGGGGRGRMVVPLESGSEVDAEFSFTLVGGDL